MAIRILRRCTKCGELKDRDKDFHHDTKALAGWSRDCKACRCARQKAHYHRRKEEREEATV